MTSKAMRRAERSARAVRDGGEILEHITATPVRRRLVAAALDGIPPVAAISGDLVDLVGKTYAKLQPVKSFVGLCVRAVLEEEGFEVSETGVRVKGDPVFRTGSVYALKQKPAPAADDFFTRLVSALNDQEVRRLATALQRRRKG